MSTTMEIPTSPYERRGLRITLWAIQALLAAIFLMSGLTKLMNSEPELAAMGMNYAVRLPRGTVPFIGISEVLGATGLILPGALRVLPKLTVAAAVGLLAIMLLASYEHFSHGEYSALPVTIGLGALAAFVAWGRLVGAPIAPRPEETVRDRPPGIPPR